MVKKLKYQCCNLINTFGRYEKWPTLENLQDSELHEFKMKYIRDMETLFKFAKFNSEDIFYTMCAPFSHIGAILGYDQAVIKEFF
jgi:hypothetical protein